MSQKFVATSIIFGALSLYGCGSGAGNAGSADSVRSVVRTQPIANFRQKVADPLNQDWFFSVQLFETHKTKDYVVRIGFEEMREIDTVHFPDLGYPIRPALQKGPDSLSCYIGFLDPKDQFLYYKAVWVENNTVNIRTVRKYKIGD